MADARGAIAAQICHELTVHASIEEQYFYPAARKAITEDAEECLDHADVEHQSLKRLIADIEAGHRTTSTTMRWCMCSRNTSPIT